MPVSLPDFGKFTGGQRDLKFWVRVGIGALLGLNLVALYFTLFPMGGSADDLDRQLSSLRSQLAQKRVALERSRRIGGNVEKGRSQGDKFLDQYFLARRTAYSTIVGELFQAAKRAQIRPREHAYTTDPIDGSDTLSMMSITANYEGSYSDLLHFVQELDRMPRLVIIETLNAAPVQGQNGLLNVTMKLDTFVREDNGALPPIPGAPEPSGDPQPAAQPLTTAAPVQQPVQQSAPQPQLQIQTAQPPAPVQLTQPAPQPLADPNQAGRENPRSLRNRRRGPVEEQ
jgi:type IV pilus assembly protein PilO